MAKETPDFVALKTRLLATMQEAGNEAQKWVPPKQRDLTFGQQIVGALFHGCLGLYRAIMTLLRDDLVEEAQILLRTLLYDTATLVYLKGQSKQLEQLAIRYVWTSARLEMRLYSEMANAGDASATSRTAAVSREMATLKKDARQLGMGDEPEGFPSPEELLNKMRQKEVSVLIKRADHSVHTSRISLGSRVQQTGENSWRFTSLGQPQDALKVGAPAADVFLAAVEASAGSLKRASAWRITRLRQQVAPKLAQILKEAKAT